MTSIDELLQVLRFVPLSSKAIQSELKASQATISRLLRRAGGRVARIGAGRATRYLSLRPLFQTPQLAHPLYAVEERGVVSQIATLHGGVDGSYLVAPSSTPLAPSPLARWLQGDSRTGRYPGLPYMLEDLRPAGFIGRQIGQRVGAEWGISKDPRGWTDDQLGRWLLLHGLDLPGDLVLGDAAAERVSSGSVAGEPLGDRGEAYPALADEALAGGLPGSSAAGEQPKLAIRQREAGAVIVKFSPRGDGAAARRWGDLLRAEHLALCLLREHGLPAVESRLFVFDGRVFLETTRFDRCGDHGRRPALSLMRIDAELVGLGAGWTRVGAALCDAGLLSVDDHERIARLELFGSWIGNSDMHLGNLALRPTHEGFALLPIYDMLPMALAPQRSELPAVQLSVPLRRAGQENLWRDAGQLAEIFWSRLADQCELDDALRRIADRRASTIQALLASA
jgi:hypothetical protein